MNWEQNITDDWGEISTLLSQTKVIAVLGIKPEVKANQPAFYVPKYLHSARFEIIPVPVYYPEVTQILGHPVYRKLVDIPFDIDLVNVFRRPQDIPAHLDDLLEKRPKAVWMQSGIRHDAIATTLAQADIKVVQDRCLMVEHQRLTQTQSV